MRPRVDSYRVSTLIWELGAVLPPVSGGTGAERPRSASRIRRIAWPRESRERRSVPDRRSLRMVSDGCRQDREVLQSGLHRLVNRPVALVGAVAVGGAQSLQLRQITVEVLVTYLLLRSARGVRYSHLLQQSDHVVTQ